MRIRAFAIVVVTATLLAACSGIRHYAGTHENNLSIRTTVESGSAFSSVDAALEVYRVDDQCQVDYQGTVRLDRPMVEVGIPVGDPSYLVFVFANSSFLGGSRSSIAHETLLSPRAGHHYDITVSYLEDMYNVAIREKKAGDGRGRVVDSRRLDRCTAG